ncbi:MAG: hypothetical protein ACOYOA_06385 [Saprospiraceae bacterium]
MKTVLKRPLAPFSKTQDIRYFCLPPDSIILVPPRFPDLSKGEIGKWVFVDGNEYSDLPQKALDAYGKVHPIFPYTYDSLRVPITGFTPGFAYEFRYTIDNGVCQVVYSQFIIVLGIKPSQTEFLANKCGQGFESQCIKQGKYCFFKPFTTLFIQGTEEKFYYRSPPKLISAPPGVTTKSIDLQNESTTFTVSQNIPYGFYVFMVVGDTSVVQEKCLQPYFYQIDLSEYPLKANAGTDVLICNTSTELPGNAVKFPNWYLLDRTPTLAATPIISGDSTANLKINGLSTDATYRFLYRSWGGRKCESLFDTVIVRTAFQTPAAPNLGADFTTCANGNITLTALPAVLPGGVEGFWSLVNQSPSGSPPVFGNNTGTSITVGNLLPNTNYTFRFMVRNGCGSAFDEITVTTSNDIGPDQPNAGRDQCLSAGSTKVLLVASQPSPTGASGQWSALSTNPTATTFDAPNNFSTLVNGLSEGKNYSFIYTVNFGVCRAMQDTIVVSVGTTKRANIADSVLVFCNSKIPASIVLNADPSVGKWSQTDGVPGAIITEPQNPTTSINNLEAGSYRFKWSVKDGACDGGVDEVIIHIGAATPIVLLGKDSTLCASSNGILQLNAPTPRGFTGYWTFEEVAPTQPSAGAFFIQNTNPGQHNAIVQLKPGKTRLRWSLVPLPPCNNLPSYDDILVEYIPNADAGIDTLKFCDGKLIELKANQIGNNTSGTWTQISGTTIPQLPKVQQGDNPIFLQLKAAGIYQFRFTINSSTCPQSSDELTVVNYALPNFPDIGTEDTICVKDAILLNANVLPPGYEAKWTINKMPANAPVPAFAPNNQSQKVRVTNLIDGKYQFQYTITNGVCTLADVREDSLHIGTIDAGPDLIICRDTVVQLNPAGSNLNWTSYQNNPAGVGIDSKTGLTGSIKKAGEYYFILIDPEGCTDDVKITKKASNSIVSSPKDITICPGNTALLNADLQISTLPYTIQWQISTDNGNNWQNISGANSAIYTTTPLLKPNIVNYFRLLLSDPVCGNDTSGIYSVKSMSDLFIKKNPQVCNLDDGNGNHLLNFAQLILAGDTAAKWVSIDAPEPPGSWSQKNFSGFIPNKSYRFVATSTTAIPPCLNVSDTVLVFVTACCPKLCVDSSKIVTCNGLNTTLDLNQLLCNNTATGIWTYISGPASGLVISASRFVNPIGLAEGKYSLKYTLLPAGPGSCPNESLHAIEVKKSPNSGQFNGKIEICPQQDTIIQVMKLLGSADMGGTWTPANLGITQAGEINPKNWKAGSYLLRYTVSGTGGCADASTTVNLVVTNAPLANAGTD